VEKDLLLFKKALEEEIGKRTNFNQDLLEQQRNVGTEIATLPSQLRETFNSSAIRDPFAQERIIASRRGGLTAQEGFLNSLLGARGQRFSDIINNSSQTVGAELADRASARAGSGGGGGFDIEQYLNDRFGNGNGEDDGTGTTDTGTQPTKKGIDLTKYGAKGNNLFDRVMGSTRIKDIGYSVADGDWGGILRNTAKSLIDPSGFGKKWTQSNFNKNKMDKLKGLFR
jgi:hypothetical protein